NAGIMTPCQTSPQLLFCPTTALGRQWAATNYDRILGLSGTPGNFVPTFKGMNVVTGGSTPPFTVDSSQKVTNLNADLLDGYDSTQVLPGAGSYSSYGGDPDATLKFLAPAASISLGTGHRALVTSSKALGTTVAGGAGALGV